jgi:hypothetical protein
MLQSIRIPDLTYPSSCGLYYNLLSTLKNPLECCAISVVVCGADLANFRIRYYGICKIACTKTEASALCTSTIDYVLAHSHIRNTDCEWLKCFVYCFSWPAKSCLIIIDRLLLHKTMTCLILYSQPSHIYQSKLSLARQIIRVLYHPPP